MIEEWRKVPGYNYEISISTKEGKCRNSITKKELNYKIDKYGRLNWSLSKNGKATNWQAARWIAQTFPELIENEYFEGAHIDHKDTDRLNNQPSNLHWVTQRENMNNPLTRKHLSSALTGKHPTEETRQKLRDTHKGERPWSINKVGKPRSVKQYQKTGELVKVYPSVSEAERETGIERVNISLNCRNKRPSAGGYVWKYA